MSTREAPVKGRWLSSIHQRARMEKLPTPVSRTALYATDFLIFMGLILTLLIFAFALGRNAMWCLELRRPNWLKRL